MYKLTCLFCFFLSSYPTSSNFDYMDASSPLDVSTELIAEMPIKQNLSHYPKTLSNVWEL